MLKNAYQLILVNTKDNTYDPTSFLSGETKIWLSRWAPEGNNSPEHNIVDTNISALRAHCLAAESMEALSVDKLDGALAKYYKNIKGSDHWTKDETAALPNIAKAEILDAYNTARDSFVTPHQNLLNLLALRQGDFALYVKLPCFTG